MWLSYTTSRPACCPHWLSETLVGLEPSASITQISWFWKLVGIFVKAIVPFSPWKFELPRIPIGEGKVRLAAYQEDDPRGFSGELDRLLYGRRRDARADTRRAIALLYVDGDHGQGTSC